MIKRIVVGLLGIVFCISSFTQNVYTTTVPFLQDEYWWGGAVGLGASMPYVKPLKEFDLAIQNNNNQVVPLFVSNKGRYIWSNRPYRFDVKDNILSIYSDYEKIELQDGGATLRDAYLAACKQYFPPSGVLPDSLFFTMPQYNTWIELIYNQNQADILKYADDIISNGFPPGVLMIDDNWQKYYGNFEFKPNCFADPKQMVNKLHKLGFKVMLWVCPFVSADSPEYRELSQKGYFIKKKGSHLPAIINWWNGQSACFDFTNPSAVDYFISQLKKLQTEYGIDGFKFDAGDNVFYKSSDIDSYQKDAISVDHTLAWAKIGIQFPFNEYRACWQMGGQELVQRLGDKDYSWQAIRLLIPEMISAGLLGYAYTCPDMIGGGQYGSFINIDQSDMDQDLIVRSTQVHALMPMMQFSVAPWRILDQSHLNIVRDMAHLHQRMGAYILECAKSSSMSGEPIIRHMEYSYPGEGFAMCNDQFMLGDKYLVAPLTTSDTYRHVKLPKGRWIDELGNTYTGGRSVRIDVPIQRLVYFEKY